MTQVLSDVDIVRQVASGAKPAAVLLLPISSETAYALSDWSLLRVTRPCGRHQKTGAIVQGRMLIAKTPQALASLDALLTDCQDQTALAEAIGEAVPIGVIIGEPDEAWRRLRKLKMTLEDWSYTVKDFVARVHSQWCTPWLIRLAICGSWAALATLWVLWLLR